ncbi:cytidyltransferase-like protein [Metamycoplasma subdolum]|uniref:tRNA(Met) cytidine acetate ligase n=1 Tax=Metamycoplasma subdolum TaxID=92407 RepID=A0A3M0A6W2_9BACT|nr:nucleotidyltransferase [Metamycoplasma subdolum]RMA78548.1 cytidyltransferase-like protein [Metamycoplasma subdolum]WPB50480.1 nucleotidyltransferase [Metamycoplasma subdolum]
MKIGLIAEFNPFHNGHKYLIQKIKEKFPKSKIICALSSDYVQRGEIAILPFEKRKEIALKFGIDEVYELDFFTSTQAAHIFAKGAIDLLLKKGIDILCFGVSDTETVEPYYNAANAIKNNLSTYNENLKKTLKEGKSFVLASYLSLAKLIGEENVPKDILGLEYVKYIVQNNLSIKAFSFKRTVEHNSEKANEIYASATLIRSLLKEGKDVSNFCPISYKGPFKDIRDLYPKFQEIICTKSSEEIAKIHLVTEGMENLFKKNIDAKSYDEFVDLCTSKRYTKSRIKRVILYILLDIKKVSN